MRHLQRGWGDGQAAGACLRTSWQWPRRSLTPRTHTAVAADLDLAVAPPVVLQHAAVHAAVHVPKDGGVVWTLRAPGKRAPCWQAVG